MSSSRQLKTKIKTVGNIRQITKAVQMVSATKMRRSQEVALNARPYAQKSFTLLLYLLNQVKGENNTPNILSQKKADNKVALLVMTSDKGLAGSFNNSVLKKASEWKAAQEAEGNEVDIVAIGKKGRDYFKRRDAKVVAEFLQFSDLITFADVQPISEWVLRAYKNNQYGKVAVCSNQFISALVQKVEVHQIFPVVIEELQKTIESITPKTGKYSELSQGEQIKVDHWQLPFILEPSPQAIMETLVKNLIQVEIMYFVFESNASEHSARMIAMKNATENAERLKDELTLKLNKARQAAITQELTEISTAKEALMAE